MVMVGCFSFFFLSGFLQIAWGCQITIYAHSEKYPKAALINDVPSGILIDIMESIGKKMGCKFIFKMAPWQRTYQRALGADGGIVGLSYNKERTEIFDYSDAMFYDVLLLIVKKGNEFEYNSIEDLRGKSLVASRGASYGDEWEHAVREKTFTLIEDNASIPNRLLFLLAERADVALVGPGLMGLNYAISQRKDLIDNRNQLSVIKKPFKVNPNYLGFSKKMKMTGFLKKFNAYLKEGYESGEFQKILDKYSP